MSSMEDLNTATTNQKINLNEFLDFLKLSCHVNDMITNTELTKNSIISPLKLNPSHDLNQTVKINNKNSSGNGQNGNAIQGTFSSGSGNRNPIIDFNELANNPLVNELFGFKKENSGSNVNTGNSLSSNLGGSKSPQNTAFIASSSTSSVACTSNMNGESDITDSTSSSGANTERSGSNLKRRNSFNTALVNYNRLNSKKSEIQKNEGLHPKLIEQLDYVINEGILDSVLPFLCPVPVAVATNNSNITNRLKVKEQKLLISGGPSPSNTTGSFSTNAPSNTLASSVKSQPGSSSSVGNSNGNEANNQSCNAEKMKLANDCCDGDGSTAAPMVKLKETSNKQGKFKTLLTSKDSKTEKRECEVVIHVCDEVKNISKDFLCSQSLLVSKMGYFADVTAGQKLEDMDISVHCDIQIFDWLMKWVKCSANLDQNNGTAGSSLETCPQLDANNVVPILVSASFLQMEPLLLDCLSFCHSRLSEVVRTSNNLSCLNDSIVTRLAAMFTNLELEMVKDKKDRLTPRLWTKLIQSLCEPEPEALRGHFYSLSGLFRCLKCNKCITNTMKSYISCTANNIRLNRWGQLVSCHIRDSNWDINQYIIQLFKELKSWRKVYWKLWGHCHFLYCCTCEMHFPVYQMSWCRFHPEGPNFLGPVTEGRIAGPAGRYPCCGQQAFRYETLPGPNGCQLREHSVLVETDRERSIFAIVQIVAENYALCENPPHKLQESIRSGEVEPRWTGLTLTPQRCRQGFLPLFNLEESSGRLARRIQPGASRYYAESSSESENSLTPEEVRNGRRLLFGDSSCDSSSTSDGCESENIETKVTFPKKARKKRTTEVSGRYWSGELSARSNQDHQREFEEKIMKHIIAIVNKKIGFDQNLGQSSEPVGGAYVRLEAEWKEQLKSRNYNANNNSNTNSNSTTNSGVNTNSIRLQKK